MKIFVNVKIESNVDANSRLDVVVREEETVSAVKDRIVALQLLPFPSQDLMLDGEVLKDGQQLSDCGVKELTSLDLVVKASRETVVKQLAELLQARDLSCDELSLLYCYKHGVNISQALKTIGYTESLQDFIKAEKTFNLEKNHVSIIRNGSSLKPFSIATEVTQILKTNPFGTMDIKELCAKFAQKFNVSLSSIVGMDPMEYLGKERELFVVGGRGIVSLRLPPAHGRSQPRKPKQENPAPLADSAQALMTPEKCSENVGLRMQKTPPPPGLPKHVDASKGLEPTSLIVPFSETVVKQLEAIDNQQGMETPPPGLPRRRCTASGDSITEVIVPPLPTACTEVMEQLATTDNQQYMDLHNKICSRSFNSKAMQALTDIVETITEIAFLNVVNVVKGGSISKGTAIAGLADAEVVFFVSGLPKVGQDQWLPPLLRAVAGVLMEKLDADRCLENIHATEDSVQLCMKGLVAVDLRFSPVFETYVQIIQTLGEQGPEARRFYNASLVKERVQFIARQPGQVKVTIRLLKWWREQQAWSGKLVRPTDELLELTAIYSAVQTKPSDQRKAIMNVMALLSRFDTLRIVWSNFYGKSDVWAPLLRQRPLLMDPVNPFVNIADPQAFDARELMEVARNTRFFW